MRHPWCGVFYALIAEWTYAAQLRSGNRQGCT
jgi:hypothetical protein